MAPSSNIDCEELDRGLQELWNTPKPTGRSPTQILYGHPLPTCVTAHSHSFSEEWQTKAEDCDRYAAARADQVPLQYYQHARPLPRLMTGQTVRVQDPTSHRCDKVGVVTGRDKSRDYEVRLPNGLDFWRNRRFFMRSASSWC